MDHDQMTVPDRAVAVARTMLKTKLGWANDPEEWLAGAAEVLAAIVGVADPGPERDRAEAVTSLAMQRLTAYVRAVRDGDVDALFDHIDLWPEQVAKEVEARALSALAEMGCAVTPVMTDDGERLYRVAGLAEAGFDVDGLDDKTPPGELHRIH